MDINQLALSVINGDATLNQLLLAVHEFLECNRRTPITDPAWDEEDVRSEVILKVPELLDEVAKGVPLEALLLRSLKFVALDVNRRDDRKQGLQDRLGSKIEEQVLDCTEFELVEIRDTVKELCSQEIWGFAFEAIVELRLSGNYFTEGKGNPFAFWANRLGYSEGYFRRIYYDFWAKLSERLAHELDLNVGT